MAEIRLGRYEAEEGCLPPLCMRCGAPATHYRPIRFGWAPLIIAILGLGVISQVFKRRMEIRAPCCDRHSRKRMVEWFTRAIRVILFLGLIIFLSLVLSRHEEWGGLLFLVLLISVPVAWYFADLALRLGQLRPLEITEDEIRLENVAAEFAESLLAEREQSWRNLRGTIRRRAVSRK